MERDRRRVGGKRGVLIESPDGKVVGFVAKIQAVTVHAFRPLDEFGMRIQAVDKTGTSLPMKLRESTLSIHRALCHVDKD